MPEVAEVAHVCALLKRNILGHTIVRAELRADQLLFPALKGVDNCGSVLAQYRARLVGARVDAVRRHGKYFWVWVARGGERTAILMHLGMSGRVRLRGVKSHMVFMEDRRERAGAEAKTERTERAEAETEEAKTEEVKTERTERTERTEVETERTEKTEAETEEEVKVVAGAAPGEAGEWPPRFSKLELVFEKDGREVEFSLADPRRLGRVRVMWGEALECDTQLMAREPLVRLGPDYSKAARLRFFARDSHDPDPDPHGRPRADYDEFARTVLARNRPIKALLLDQALFAGVGNWVADEVLYHAHLHPADVLRTHIHDAADARLEKLYRSLVYVMEFSVSVEGNVGRFPKHWLMPHRWGKRDKVRAKTDAGEVAFETVGGRTSCFVPARQKPMRGRAKPRAKDAEPAQELGDAAMPTRKRIRRA